MTRLATVLLLTALAFASAPTAEAGGCEPITEWDLVVGWEDQHLTLKWPAWGPEDCHPP